MSLKLFTSAFSIIWHLQWLYISVLLIFLDPVVVNSTYGEKILGNYTRKVWIVTRSMECNAETVTLCSRRTANGECENRPALIEKMSGSCKVKITLNETFNTTGYYVKFNQFRNVHDRVGFYKLETKQGN